MPGRPKYLVSQVSGVSALILIVKIRLPPLNFNVCRGGLSEKHCIEMEIALNLWKCVSPLVIAFPEEIKPSLICARLYRRLHFISLCGVCVFVGFVHIFMCGLNY